MAAVGRAGTVQVTAVVIAGRGRAPSRVMPAAASARPMILSTTRMSACPVTTGTFGNASQAAASASFPVRYPGSPAAPRSHTSSASGAPGRCRSSGNGICTATWVSAPARSGTIFAPISSSQPACSASWNRCPSVRGSSDPAFLPSASSTACTAAAHSGVRLPRITPAPPNVVAACTYRSSNPSSSASGREARHFCSSATPAIIRRSSSDAPAGRPAPGS